MEQTRAWIEEEKLKEAVYTSFEQKMQTATENLRAAQQELDEQKFEDAYAAQYASARNKAGREKTNLAQQIVALTHRPYFTHIGVQWQGDDVPEHYLFSDSEQLDAEFKVSEGRESVTILPFKQYDDKPLYNKLRILCNMPNGNDVEVVVNGERSVCAPQLIRMVDIKDRKLSDDVKTLFPADAQSADQDETAINADELLAQRLEENRTDARLRNIIATLQKKQFEIIQADVNSSFAVQGCAGSGKTQCLIHRLFFLRESLSESGWDKVMLITPTRLFRNYAAELMRRYRLTDIANLSLAEFYCKLLETYDSRFRSRQYAFELSEEYLPDEYLRTVYDSPMIATIDNEIKHALWVHVDNGLSLLGETLSPNARIDIDLVNRVAERLAERIDEFDKTEKSLAELPEYAEHRAMIDTLEKQQKALLRRQSDLMEAKEKLAGIKKQFELYQQAVQAAEIEAESWKLNGDADLQKLAATLRECRDALNRCGTPAMAQPALSYAEALFNLCDAAEPWGKKNAYNKEYLELLEEIVKEAKQKLRSFTGGLSAEAWLRDHDKRTQANKEALQKVDDGLAQNQQEQDSHSRWLSTQNVENADKQRSSQRAALERARYYLTRIESAVFEQDVWNVLTPYKKASGIQTLIVEQLPDGHQKQTRILYKSDLLFYLKIYAALRPTSALPDYGLICIDEGQDLHRADYDFLRRLYPRARFNIFGDTVQSLHDACGVSDWRRDAGVNTVYEMKNNYRNAPAIVDFCNRMFGERMEYCGSIRSEQRPTMVRDRILLGKVIRQPNQTVILKDKQAFEELLRRAELSRADVVYIDTKANEIPAGKIPCYTIFAAKGLEFTRALVYAKDMSRNQKIVACTRAMEQLYYCE